MAGTMALIVQKYGGTSVGSPERIKHVAKRVAKWFGRGHRVVVVVSAMAGETNRLIALAKDVQMHPNPRELDVMVSTGEQVTIALLTMATEKPRSHAISASARLEPKRAHQAQASPRR